MTFLRFNSLIAFLNAVQNFSKHNDESPVSLSRSLGNNRKASALQQVQAYTVCSNFQSPPLLSFATTSLDNLYWKESRRGGDLSPLTLLCTLSVVLQDSLIGTTTQHQMAQY